MSSIPENSATIVLRKRTSDEASNANSTGTPFQQRNNNQNQFKKVNTPNRSVSKSSENNTPDKEKPVAAEVVPIKVPKSSTPPPVNVSVDNLAQDASIFLSTIEIQCVAVFTGNNRYIVLRRGRRG